MNKTEMIEHIANQTALSKADAQRAFEAAIAGIETTLKKGDTVSLLGFGSFSITQREARTGLNPKTKEPISIKASKSVKFKPGKALKDAVQ
jgi:DNA-binding protein HU-beta